MDILKNIYRVVRDRRSFSAIEVMIVGVIMVIIFTVAVVNFQGIFKSAGFENTAQKVVSFLRYAQTYAVTHQKQYTMDILPDENKLVVKLDDDKELKLELPENYSMETDAAKIVFGYTGGFDIADANDPKNFNKTVGTITITNKEGKQAKVEFWAFGGYIRVKSKYFGKIPSSSGY